MYLFTKSNGFSSLTSSKRGYGRVKYTEMNEMVSTKFLKQLMALYNTSLSGVEKQDGLDDIGYSPPEPISDFQKDSAVPSKE